MILAGIGLSSVNYFTQKAEFLKKSEMCKKSEGSDEDERENDREDDREDDFKDDVDKFLSEENALAWKNELISVQYKNCHLRYSTLDLGIITPPPKIQG